MPDISRKTKRCPACAEDILGEARVCRFCRYDFETGKPSPIFVETPGLNALAILSLVFGLIWIGGITSFLALGFGYRAKGQIERSAGRETGRPLALAGIILGWIGVGLMAIYIVSFIMPAG